MCIWFPSRKGGKGRYLDGTETATSAASGLRAAAGAAACQAGAAWGCCVGLEAGRLRTAWDACPASLVDPGAKQPTKLARLAFDACKPDKSMSEARKEDQKQGHDEEDDDDYSHD